MIADSTILQTAFSMLKSKGPCCAHSLKQSHVLSRTEKGCASMRLSFWGCGMLRVPGPRKVGCFENHNLPDLVDEMRTALPCPPDACEVRVHSRFRGTYPKTNTWTPKVCRVMAFWAVFSGSGPLFLHVFGV